MSWPWRRPALICASLAFATCDPRAAFIDPTGKSCTPTLGCPKGWSCVPPADGSETICWPSVDAGAPDSGLPDSGLPFDAGGDGGPDAGRDAGLDAGNDGGRADGGEADGGDGGLLDGGLRDGGSDGGDGGSVDGGPRDGGADGGPTVDAGWGCTIGGSFFPAGTANPGNACQLCDPAQSPGLWSHVPDGTACGTGLACAGGSCCGGLHGTLTCSGQPIDSCLDDLNCGACGTTCTAPNGCFAGVCQLPALLPTARDSMAVAAGPDGRIYAMGGYLYATTVTVATVEIFDPRTNLWSTGPSLPTPVELAGAVADDGGVFVMGGYDCATAGQCNAGTGTTEGVGQFLDVGTGAWSQTSAAGVTFSDTYPAIGPGGVFFIPGGVGTASPTETLRFTPTGVGAGGSWSNSGPALPLAAWDMGVTAGLDGTVYSINGTNTNTAPLTEVLALPPGATSWKAVANDATPRCDLAAATDRLGRVYAIGGDNCPNNPAYTQYGSTEIFDPTAGSWSTASPLPNPIAYITAAVGPEGRIYVIGGLDFQDESYVQVYDPVSAYWIP
ncbi:MAG: hypothetical protein ACYDCL_13990 [Myxococcales bacterium]